MRLPFSMLSPSGGRAKLSVLIFHRVLAAPDPLFPSEPDAAWFDMILARLSRWFKVIPLAEAIGRLAADSLPDRAMCITFDDGYADNFRIALPILEKHRLPATVFVATAFLNGGRMFNDSVIEAVRGNAGPALDLSDLNLGVLTTDGVAAKRAAIRQLLGAVKYLPQRERDDLVSAIAERSGAVLPDDLMMTTAELHALSTAGVTIGAHTRTHPILARLAPAEARQEIAENREELEHLVGRKVDLFAYPNGQPGIDYNREHVDMVRDLGFAGAVSTAWGVARSGADLFQIPRFTPWDRTPHRFGIRLARNLLSRNYAMV